MPAMSTPTLAPSDQYIADYDAILKAMDFYISGLRAGNGETMSQGFLPNAAGAGYFQGSFVSGSMQQVFDLVTQNGPAPDLTTRFASVDVLGTIAVVRLEVNGWSGNVAGLAGLRMSDVFTLAKADAGWKIAFKGWHFHST
jgi:hypothetical protein